MAVTVIAEDGFIEWRWDVRVIWKDTLLSAKMRSVSSSEKDLSLEACRILCVKMVFVGSYGRRPPKEWSCGARGNKGSVHRSLSTFSGSE